MSENGAKRERGTGHIYQRGRIWWIEYYRNGRQFRESSRSPVYDVAKKKLKKRLAQIETGQLRSLLPERVRFDELAADLKNDYSINRRKSGARNRRSLKHLEAFFGGMRALDITTDRVRQYVSQRQDEGAANATINRELAALKRMFSLARQMTPPKVQEVPYIPMLKEPPPRAGFLSDDHYKKLRDALPTYLRPVFAMAYFTGMRASEILGLCWKHVDLTERIVRLDPGTTKNDQGRVLSLTDELFHLLSIQKQFRDAKFPECEWVFFRNGQQVRSYRKAWETAAKAIGLPGLLFHDLRRTGVRNMRRAGVTETVAMKISGHKTRSIFDRYNIVDEQDVKEATKKLDAFLKDRHNSVTIAPSDQIPTERKPTISRVN